MTSGVSIGGIGAAHQSAATGHARPGAAIASTALVPVHEVEPIVLTPFRGPVGALVWIQATAARGPQSSAAGAARAYERAAAASGPGNSISV